MVRCFSGERCRHDPGVVELLAKLGAVGNRRSEHDGLAAFAELDPLTDHVTDNGAPALGRRLSVHSPFAVSAPVMSAVVQLNARIGTRIPCCVVRASLPRSQIREQLAQPVENGVAERPITFAVHVLMCSTQAAYMVCASSMMITSVFGQSRAPASERLQSGTVGLGCKADDSTESRHAPTVRS